MYFLNKILHRVLRPAVALTGLSVLVACGQPDEAVTRSSPPDPYEKFNRKVHKFNRGLDRVFIRPVGKGYSSAIPDDIETAIGRFAFNLSIPSAVVNNILQGNMRGAFNDTARFAVNTTVGLGGFFDPASEMSMATATDADFGQTLYVWGVPSGNYGEVPVLGPGTDRHMAGKVVDLFSNPLTYILPEPERYYGTGASIAARLSDRARYSDTIDSVLYESEDSYAATRSLYLQNRRFRLDRGRSDTYQDPYDELYGVPSEDPSNVASEE
ncbi:VacJ family lipoprotein [uncultured Roseovarius sp.]|uniref:MlaA family lipoprotein n=1 Tax=uncultured Roseovarius sp. TaxID=293344 RepID=UPI00262CBB1B|nr:VacJ family lipoprotein [uncultured Roseovarius sp.]